MKPTAIELHPDHTALVFDKTGQLIELYMPDHQDDENVPPKIIEVLNLILKDAPNAK